MNRKSPRQEPIDTHKKDIRPSIPVLSLFVARAGLVFRGTEHLQTLSGQLDFGRSLRRWFQIQTER